MTPFTLLQELKRNGVDLWVEGNAIRYQGPADTLTPDIMETLKKMKPTLMQILQNGSCTKCKHHEEIPDHGPGCVHTPKSNYQYQWSQLDKLLSCPRDYWN